jgi:hypothetical protein
MTTAARSTQTQVDSESYHPLWMASVAWKGQLTFGRVSIPVRLYCSARKERASLQSVLLREIVQPPTRHACRDLARF